MKSNEATADSDGYQNNTSIANPQLENTAIIKPEMTERKLEEEQSQNERPSKRHRIDNRDDDKDSNERRKGIAIIKPELVSHSLYFVVADKEGFDCLASMVTQIVEHWMTMQLNLEVRWTLETSHTRIRRRVVKTKQDTLAHPTMRKDFARVVPFLLNFHQKNVSMVRNVVLSMISAAISKSANEKIFKHFMEAVRIFPAKDGVYMDGNVGSRDLTAPNVKTRRASKSWFS